MNSPSKSTALLQERSDCHGNAAACEAVFKETEAKQSDLLRNATTLDAVRHIVRCRENERDSRSFVDSGAEPPALTMDFGIFDPDEQSVQTPPFTPPGQQTAAAPSPVRSAPAKTPDRNPITRKPSRMDLEKPDTPDMGRKRQPGNDMPQAAADAAVDRTGNKRQKTNKLDGSTRKSAVVASTGLGAQDADQPEKKQKSRSNRPKKTNTEEDEDEETSDADAPTTLTKKQANLMQKATQTFKKHTESFSDANIWEGKCRRRNLDAAIKALQGLTTQLSHVIDDEVEKLCARITRWIETIDARVELIWQVKKDPASVTRQELSDDQMDLFGSMTVPILSQFITHMAAESLKQIEHENNGQAASDDFFKIASCKNDRSLNIAVVYMVAAMVDEDFAPQVCSNLQQQVLSMWYDRIFRLKNSDKLLTVVDLKLGCIG